MIKILSQIFIKNNKNYTDPAVRRGYGILCAVSGIVLNLIMFLIKMAVGAITGSVAVSVDAIHNLTDSASSVAVFFGFLFSTKSKTKKFPSGLGRIEYIAGFLISVILISTGFKLASASITKIITPEPVIFSLFSVIMLLISVLTKFYMAKFNYSYGKRISSSALKAASTDCLCDSIATMIAAFALTATNFTSFNIDAWGGLAVSLFILYAGCKSAKDCFGQLLGMPPDEKMLSATEQLKKLFPQIYEISDIALHDYGANNKILSFRVIFEENTDIASVYSINKEISTYISNETGCVCNIII